MKTTDCVMNTRQLLLYLEAPSQHPAIETHLRTCRSCRKKLARLSQAAQTQQSDGMTCGQCQAQLPDYAQAQIEGRDFAQLFIEAHNHLALCPHCQRLYQQLLEIDDLLSAGGLPEPATYSPPDLSFLRRSSAPERLGDIIRRGAYWTQSRTRTLIVDMQAFVSLGRQPTLAPAIRGEEHKPDEMVYQIILGPEKLDDLDVEVTVHRQPDRPGAARVVIYVRVPSRLSAGFTGSQVEMKTGETTRTVRTDDDGRAVFEDVLLDDLKATTFEITPA